ncbi:hypothetical protein [Riemerella anatipestifer]|uniref:hypothetical protein n=1 Tax=Riemerella anatipestifer TaxID=34085 RepID=UPI003DA8D789
MNRKKLNSDPAEQNVLKGLNSFSTTDDLKNIFLNEPTLKKYWRVQLATHNTRLNVGLLKLEIENKTQRKEPQTDENRKNEWISELKTSNPKTTELT